MKLLTLILLLIAGVAAAEIISTNRLAPWQDNVGIPGGIPNRTTIFSNVTAGTTSTVLQSILNACPSNQVVLLASGNFTNTAGIKVPTGVTLRGAGISNTLMWINGGYTGDMETDAGIGFGTSMFLSRGGSKHTATNGYTAGSTSVTCSTTPSGSVGDLMEISQTNYASIPVTILGHYGDATSASRDEGVRAMGQIVLITNISSRTISFSPPLFYTMTAAQKPEVVIFTPPVTMAGIEDMSLMGKSTGPGMHIAMGSVKYCWAKNIENNFPPGDHLRAGSSFRCEIRGCNFHDSFQHGSGSYDNPLMLLDKTSNCLIEDNIFYRTHCAVMFNSGAAGNVLAYNYLFNPYDTLAEYVQMYEVCLNHRAHPSFNLIEGNISGQIRSDRAWGSSSHQTIFRNYITCSAYIQPPYNARGALEAGHWANQALRGISIDAVNENFNVVGNILKPLNTPSGGVSYLAVYPDSVTYSDKIYLLNFGQDDIGGSNYPDSQCYSNAIIHGNWDSVSTTQRWDGAISDHSLPNSYYLSSKPTFFGALTWPPFDPSSSSTAAATAQVTNIPAGYRYTYGTNPPAAGEEASSSTANIGTLYLR